MYACRKPTRISKPVTPTCRPNGPIAAMIGDVRQRVRGEQRQGGEQDVAGDHVGEESDGQRERPHEERLHELDRRHEDVAGPSARPAGTGAREVLEALVLEPDEPVDEVDHDREEQRDAMRDGRRELDERDDFPEVQEEDEEEQRAEERRVARRVVADDVTRDAAVDELVRHLERRSACPRGTSFIFRLPPTKITTIRSDRRQHDEQRRLVDRERRVLERRCPSTGRARRSAGRQRPRDSHSASTPCPCGSTLVDARLEAGRGQREAHVAGLPDRAARCG